MVVEVYSGCEVAHRGRTWIVMETKTTDDVQPPHARGRVVLLRPIEWDAHHRDAGLRWQWTYVEDIVSARPRHGETA